jgi:hypothetical protein
MMVKMDATLRPAAKPVTLQTGKIHLPNPRYPACDAGRPNHSQNKSAPSTETLFYSGLSCEAASEAG